MWVKCTGDKCKLCKEGKGKISSSLVMPNTNNDGVYVHHIQVPKEVTR